jgi:hypothetical protein
MRRALALVLVLVLAGDVASGSIAAPALLRRLQDMEDVVLGLAQEAESAFSIHHRSCSQSLGASCAGTLLSACASELPSPVCDGSGPSMEACGNDAGCGMRVDYSTSNVRVPEGADLLTSIVPLEVGARTIDSLCWQQRLVPVFQKEISNFRFRQDNHFEGYNPLLQRAQCTGAPDSPKAHSLAYG